LKLPLTGKAFISVTNADKGQAAILARRLVKLGFDLVATYGTAIRMHEVGLDCASVFKVNEGRPNIADLIRQGEISLIINTPLGKTSHYDEKAIRKAALQFNVPCVTTITGAEALVEAIATKKSEDHLTVRSLQEIHQTSMSIRQSG
ncbi:MAG: carbamoyl phosphate synthase large subunit, partial [Blastocatellia bacterium]|nr:carbamoyl phosphate synthase large subunit [Blastocatellia bacterium]